MKKDKYTEFPVNIKVVADYKQLLEFIHQMAFTDTLLTVRDLRLTRLNPPTNNGYTLLGEMVVKGAMTNDTGAKK